MKNFNVYELEGYKMGIGKGIILTLLTCGIYNLFWQNHQIKTVNFLLKRNELSFWKWFFFSLLTCGLYHIYYEYVMAQAIIEIQSKYQFPIQSGSLPTVAIILSIIGLPLVVDAIEQKELNGIIEHIFSRK